MNRENIIIENVNYKAACVGEYYSIDILKILMAILVVVRYLGQNYLAPD